MRASSFWDAGIDPSPTGGEISCSGGRKEGELEDVFYC